MIRFSQRKQKPVNNPCNQTVHQHAGGGVWSVLPVWASLLILVKCVWVCALILIWCDCVWRVVCAGAVNRRKYESWLVLRDLEVSPLRRSVDGRRVCMWINEYLANVRSHRRDEVQTNKTLRVVYLYWQKDAAQTYVTALVKSQVSYIEIDISSS